MIFALTGMALLCAMDAVVKALPPEMPTVQIVCLRFLATAAFMAGWLLAKRPGWPRLDRLGAHAIRAVIMVLSAASFFYALARMPLAELFAICLTSPLFIALLGAVFLRERVRLAIMGAIAMGFAGVLVIVGDGFGGAQTVPVGALIAALLSPVIYGSGIVLLRAQTAHESPEVIVFVQSLLASLMIAPVVAADFLPLDRNLVLSFALVGLFGASGYLCYAYALSLTTAARFSIVEYTGLLWAAFFGYVFFAEVPRLAVWLGAALIIGACLLVLREKKAKPS
jgi:drug/metabolite transporter (DMT)-like permease